MYTVIGRSISGFTLLVMAVVPMGCGIYDLDSVTHLSNQRILLNNSWKPFVHRASKFSHARSSYDNGKAFFVMQSEYADSDAYFGAVANQDVEKRWRQIDHIEEMEVFQPSWVREGLNSVRTSPETKKIVQRYFARRVHPNIEDQTIVEIVEISFAEGSRQVALFSMYVDSWEAVARLEARGKVGK